MYWKVAIAKGQVLRVRATVDTSEIETDFSANDYLPGLDNLDYQLDLFSPLREPLSDEYDWRDASDDLEGDDRGGREDRRGASPRALGFEQILGTDFSVDKFPAPGEWYISRQRRRLRSPHPAEMPAELPVELEVSVEGDGPAVVGRLRLQAARPHAGADGHPPSASERWPAATPTRATRR